MNLSSSGSTVRNTKISYSGTKISVSPLHSLRLVFHLYTLYSDTILHNQNNLSVSFSSILRLDIFVLILVPFKKHIILSVL